MDVQQDDFDLAWLESHRLGYVDELGCEMYHLVRAEWFDGHTLDPSDLHRFIVVVSNVSF